MLLSTNGVSTVVEAQVVFMYLILGLTLMFCGRSTHLATNFLIQYWDGSYLKCHYGKPVIGGVLVGPSKKIDELMLTIRYWKYPENEFWCKTIDKWPAKDPSFMIYNVMNPTLMPNGHLY